tara:strand:- start:2883 stop:3221 length:339 start_codon:yes stop_codon:yes gene_type:complete
MHPVSGLDILKNVRNLGSARVVLVTSLESYDPMVIACCDFEKVTYLNKPISIDKVSKVMDYQIGLGSVQDLSKQKKSNTQTAVYSRQDWRPPSGKSSGATQGLRSPALYRLL